MLYFKLLSMEINLNCDLGEKSKHHSNENDPELLKIVNSANVACGYHAGDEQTMQEVVKISKENNVSIGAHPSFNDPGNFGRKRMNLSASEVNKLITTPIPKVTAKPFTKLGPSQTSAIQVISVVKCPSTIEEFALWKPLLIDLSKFSPFLSD